MLHAKRYEANAPADLITSSCVEFRPSILVMTGSIGQPAQQQDKCLATEVGIPEQVHSCVGLLCLLLLDLLMILQWKIIVGVVKFPLTFLHALDRKLADFIAG